MLGNPPPVIRSNRQLNRASLRVPEGALAYMLLSERASDGPSVAIGAGAVLSRRHMPDILRNENATLTALCRRDAETVARLGDHFGPERTYTDWRRMLDECPLDAVVIATPNHLHFEQAKAAM